MFCSPLRRPYQSGDVVFFVGTDLLSQFIRVVTRSAYSHVGFVVVESDGTFLYEDVPGVGVRRRPIVDAVPFDMVSGEWRWTGWADNTATRELGKAYRYLDAIRVGLGLFPDRADGCCSLYAGRVLEECGLRLSRRGLTPERLMEDLLDNGGVVRRMGARG
jgi:hypothetical protein